MSWINFFFFVIILNTITGTVAYLLCKLLTWIAEKAGAIRAIYPMYRLVLIFYIVPLGWLYVYITHYRTYGTVGVGEISPLIILPEKKYSPLQLQVILLHEGMHIVRFDNLAKRIVLILTLINWFNPSLKPYIHELDEWADVSCDISVCKRFFGGRFSEYYHGLIGTTSSRHSNAPPFVSQLNKSTEFIKRRVNYMKLWKRSGSKKLVSALLMATLIVGSSVTAFAASSQVVDQQNEIYRETCVSEHNATYVDANTELHMIPADQVDEQKWNEAVVYEEDLLDPLTVQKNFTWTVPAQNFARSTAFIKQKGGQIVVSCYLYSDLNHRVGIRRPDGSQLYVIGTHQVAATFPCEKTGTYYVYVENMGRVDIKASGYYIR